MTPIAVLFLVISIVVVWGGLLASILHLRAHPTDDLGGFLDDTGVEMAQVVRKDKSWTTLRRDAGLLVGEPSPLETALARRARAVAHVDDSGRAWRIAGCSTPAPTTTRSVSSSSAWRGCCSSRCGPMAAGSARMQRGSTDSARRRSRARA